MKKRKNLLPILIFFSREITPKDFADLLDNLLHNYFRLILRSLKEDDNLLDDKADHYVYYLGRLRDYLNKCKE